MKSILISIKPKYVADILNGEKTIEIRKTMPKCDLPIDVYIYCTKGEEKWWRHDNLNTFGKLSKDVEKQFCAYGMTARELDDKLLDFLYVKGIKESISRGVHATLLNGKVVAKFTLNKVEEIGMWNYSEYGTQTLFKSQLCIKSCLNFLELKDYIKDKPAYAWHISNLIIFDKPKELSEFRKVGKQCKYQGRDTYCDYCSHCDCIGDELTKAPQSWCYVEKENDEDDRERKSNH